MKNQLKKLKNKIEEISPFVIVASATVLSIGTVAVLHRIQSNSQERYATKEERDLIAQLEHEASLMNEPIK